MTKEMTKVQALELVIDVIGKVNQGGTYDELLEKLEKMQSQEIKVTERKKDKKKPSKVAQEKMKHAEKVKTWFFEESDPETFYSGAEISLAVGLVDEKTGNSFTPQKMTPILKVLLESGDVEKGQTEDKKVGYKVK